MKRFFTKAKSEDGSVSIEATLSLTAFLFAFIMIYSIISLCRAQAKMQIALNNTAQEISQYSYLYGMTGLDESLKKFHDKADETKSDVNKLVGNVADVFDSIQQVGKDAQSLSDTPSINIGNIDSLLDKCEGYANDINNAVGSVQSVQAQIEAMASNPQELMFGMARLVVSETMTVAVSRFIAAPVTRALIQKHLKRSATDTADAFCRSVGIVGGFNGIDFTHSTLFPKASEEITLIAAYKVRLLQLLPIKTELSITQSASTKGWLHGDGTANNAENLVQVKADEKGREMTIWNKYSLNKRNDVIRSLELDELVKEGYSRVSGETYLQAYNQSTNTVLFVAICNPIYGVSSVDKDSVKTDLKRQVDELRSSTDNRYRINVKYMDKGNVKIKTVECGKTELHGKIRLIVPEDDGVQSAVEQAIQEMGYSEYFEVKAKYGTGKKLD